MKVRREDLSNSFENGRWSPIAITDFTQDNTSRYHRVYAVNYRHFLSNYEFLQNPSIDEEPIT